MNTRTKLLTASAGVLLLAGVGGTLALWSDATSGDNLVAATGHLEVDITGKNFMYSMSPYCNPTFDNNNVIVWQSPGCNINPRLISVDGSGNPIDTANGTIALTDFKMVPGDVIRVAAPIEVDLYGQNIAATLVANLDYDTLAATDGVDPSNTALGNQFTVTTIGIWDVNTMGDAPTADDASVFVVKTGGSATHNFISSTTSDEEQFVFAVIEIAFLDKGASQDVDGTDHTGPSDLMDVSALHLIDSLDVSLTQIRPIS